MENYLGQIMAVGFNFAPTGWALCNGQLLGIQQNSALFSLLGIAYGGDGRTNFGLPDLRGRVITGISVVQGARGGEENVTLTTAQMPSHTHSFLASNATAAAGRGQLQPAGNIFGAAADPTQTLFDQPAGEVPLAPFNIGPAGSSQGHPNLQPYLTLNYIIALVGIFPSRN